ncbi:hypothetical protein DdX_03608 [Ditylenchus destructor]|uniref:Uncharacterized protein n=1 Tax=Ditylenchus destructor TaxID=166010 RepID=A0AAD4NFF9_9BILA|nr:hypothetical protein DdX_03608 [Ditylenchus destructor]
MFEIYLLSGCHRKKNKKSAKEVTCRSGTSNAGAAPVGNNVAPAAQDKPSPLTPESIPFDELTSNNHAGHTEAVGDMTYEVNTVDPQEGRYLQPKKLTPKELRARAIAYTERIKKQQLEDALKGVPVMKETDESVELQSKHEVKEDLNLTQKSEDDPEQKKMRHSSKSQKSTKQKKQIPVTTEEYSCKETESQRPSKSKKSLSRKQISEQEITCSDSDSSAATAPMSRHHSPKLQHSEKTAKEAKKSGNRTPSRKGTASNRLSRETPHSKEQLSQERTQPNSRSSAQPSSKSVLPQ